MRVLYDFNKFIIFKDLLDYDFIDFKCLRESSIVIYACVSRFHKFDDNGVSFILSYNDLQYVDFDDFFILAINEENNTCLEVKK